MAELPAWVYDVVMALQRWAEVHPVLYREGLMKDGKDVYLRTETCGCEPLEHVPDDVKAHAEAIAAYLRAQPAPTLKQAVDRAMGGWVSPGTIIVAGEAAE